MASWQSILDIDPTLGNGGDATAAINSALDWGRQHPQDRHRCGVTLYLPDGKYVISSTIREDTQSGALRLIGESQWGTIIQAAPIWTKGAPMIHLGKNDGHGCYRPFIQNLTLDGLAKSKGAIGLRLDQCGIGIVSGVTFRNCDIALWNRGSISLSIRDQCQFETCNRGLISDIYAGMAANCLEVVGAWFSAMMQEALIHRNSGLAVIRGNVFQSPTMGGGTNAVLFETANSGSGYGDGPIFEDNWTEGGDYLFAAYFNNTQNAKVKNNCVFGVSGSQWNMEGGFGFAGSPGWRDDGNSFFGFFHKPPSGGRAGNYAIWADTGSPRGKSDATVAEANVLNGLPSYP